METQIEFPKFLAGLKEAGVETTSAQFLKNPPGAWNALPTEARALFLEALGFAVTDPNVVEIKLGKRANAPKTLENVLVILRAPDPPRPELAAIAGAVSAPSASASTLGSGLAPAGTLAAAPTLAPATAPPAPVSAAAPASPATPAIAAAETAAAASAIAANAAAQAAAAASEEAAADDMPKKGEKKPGEKKGILGKFLAKKAGEEIPSDAPVADLGTITEFPPLPGPHVEEITRYAVQEPYAFIRISHDKEAHEHVYEVIEPSLSERERNILEFIEDTLIDVIEIPISAMKDNEAAEMLRKNTDEIIYDYSITLSPVSKEKLLYYILRDFLGYGILDPMMRDDLIEDISCDGPMIPIFLYHRKFESLRSNVKWPAHEELDSYVIRMAQRSGKHVSIAEPLLDATLPDGSRLNATLSDEVTAKGSTFTIRKFRDDPFTPPDLVRFGTMSPEILAYWWMAVQNGASAIYAGGTASGKTTSLNAILLFIPPQMKIVSIEDTREINIPHENWIAGVTRSGFGPRDNHGRQAGEIDMFTLLKASLRQRPEYILVGEVRGAEATALFQAMATGHTAYGTMHADSTESVIHRLESEPISIPRSLLESLDIVSIQIQTRIHGKRVRRTKEIVEIVGLDPHTREILTNEVYNWNPASDKFEYSGVSYVLERIQIERNMTEHQMREEMAMRKEIIQYMIDRELRDYRQVAKVIVSYYKDPKGTIDRMRADKAAMAATKAEEAAAAAKEAAAKAAEASAKASADPANEELKLQATQLALEAAAAEAASAAAASVAAAAAAAAAPPPDPDAEAAPATPAAPDASAKPPLVAALAAATPEEAVAAIAPGVEIPDPAPKPLEPEAPPRSAEDLPEAAEPAPGIAFPAGEDAGMAPKRRSGKLRRARSQSPDDMEQEFARLRQESEQTGQEDE